MKPVNFIKNSSFINKKFFVYFSIIFLSFNLIFSFIFVPKPANADAGLTLGIIGTTLGATALRNQVTCSGIGCLSGYAGSPSIPRAMPVDKNFLQAFKHINYDAPCGYPGWYSPYGHVGIPCMTCHTFPN